MKEELLHFIWKYKLLKPGIYHSVKGRKIKIVHPGELNTNSGPDFFNSKIEVDGVLLAGNVEIHIRSSDWMKHGHQTDTSYNNLVLHAVYLYDKPVAQNTDFNVEVLELKDHVSKEILDKYDHLTSSKSFLACAGRIQNVNPVKLNSWLQRMLIERLEIKTALVKRIFESSGNDYSQCLYSLLARNFGFKVNAEPFELLSKHLPLHIVLKHKENLFQLEALLYGTAGLLEETFSDKYLQGLQNEFAYLKNKYQLLPINGSLWKFSRMRPANFPSVRLWQFASLIHHAHELFSSPISYSTPSELRRAISKPPANYWSEHYKPGGSRVPEVSAIGSASVENLVINTMAPYLFFYGKQTGKDDHIEMALRALDEIEFEHNSKTSAYIEAGLDLKTASESQALIHLYDQYCKEKQCLRCSVASEILCSQA
jgi:hypothetical protein